MGPRPLFPRLLAPDSRRALRFGERELDYATLATACAAFRRSLASLRLEKGARVAVWAHPELETLLGFVGCVSNNMVTVPLNPSLGDKELAHILQDAKPSAIFSAYPERDRARSPGFAVHSFAFTQDSMVTPRAPKEDNESPDEPSLLVYTSGTTGAPKGAVLSYRNLASTLDGLTEAWRLTEEDTIVHALPLFHVHGLVFGLFGALRVGASLHWIPKFDPATLASALDAHSVLYAVPTMYRRLAEAAEQDAQVRKGLSSARLLVSGSAALPAREHARIERLTGQQVCERYGLSETLINTAVRADGERRPGYVGRALPGVEVRLVDDDRQPIEVHDDATIGEVAVRGPNVFIGYLNRPEATLAALDEHGWFYTGDLGTMTPDGYLRIVGRKGTDLIKTGGFKVGAGEVEGALLEHAAVREAAVLGVADEDLGERIVAYVVLYDHEPQPPEQELVDHVAKSLAPHKRPREVRYVSELPRNAMGKVQKAKLRELS
ncbi:MAG: AMP-binding protein [Myxococcales bacterium]